MPLQTAVLTPSEFDQMQSEWNELLARSACDSVFLRWEWIHTWWTIFHKNRSLFILTAREGDRLLGLAPFYLDPGVFPHPRRLRFCSEEVSPDYMDLVIEKGQEEPVTQAVIHYLKTHSAEWDVLHLDNLRANSTLLKEGIFGGLAKVSRVSLPCPYIKMQGTFDDYYRTQTRLARFELEKKQQRFFQQPGISYVRVTDPESLPRHIDSLFALRTKRSESMNLETTFAGDDVKHFHLEVSRLFLAEGILDYHLIYDGRTPVSLGYAFLYKNKTHLFQTAFDPEYKKWSPGGLILRLLIQQAFVQGLREFDMLKGDDAYKSYWCNTIREEMLLKVYNRTWRGWLWLGLHRLKNFLRPVKHKLMPKQA